MKKMTLQKEREKGRRSTMRSTWRSKKKIIENVKSGAHCERRSSAVDKWQIPVETNSLQLEGWICLQKKNHSADSEKDKGILLFVPHYLVSLKNYKTDPRRLSYIVSLLTSFVLRNFSLLRHLISRLERLLELKNQNNFLLTKMHLW